MSQKTSGLVAISCLLLGLLAGAAPTSAQWTGLRVQGQQIVDENGKNVLLRGFGNGEMYNTEAYMLEWSEGEKEKALWFYGYTRIHETIAALAGKNVDDEFTAIWEANMVTDADVATWASWGVNSIRFSINYHWLSAEDGKYLDSGWAKIDHFVALCKKHGIKVVLCLHAAPGAQSPELMADSRDGAALLWTKPEVYQPWTIHLWQAIAERYAREPAVAGYDLLDEPLLSEKEPIRGGEAVRAFYVRVTSAIRSVDKNHIIFACGTDWCGSVAGVMAILPPWDDNMVLVLHDYNEPFDAKVIEGLVSLRSQYNIPVWDGESGEHSNVWARELVTTLESNNIGWSWWTLKKIHGSAGKSNNTTQPYEIPEPAHYGDILKYVKTFGAGKPPSQREAGKIFLGLAANSATSKCTFNPELIKALFGK